MAERQLQQISIAGWNLGGISDSKYQGLENSLYRMVGCDIHSEPGALKVAQKLTKESGTTVDAFVKNAVACSDGKSYWFSSTSGKIWERTSAGAWSLVHTDANGAILGAAEYNGYLYWATAAKLGRWQLGTNWSTASDSWATFTIGDTVYKPMCVVVNVLYIGDGKYIAQVDNATFTANALATIRAERRVVSLAPYGTELMIGEYISSNVNESGIDIWNTYSELPRAFDDVPGVGVNALCKMDNLMVAQVGTKGDLYYFDNIQMQHFKKIPGNWSGTAKAIVHADAMTQNGGNLLIGLSDSSGAPALQGVYTLGRYASNYPWVLDLTYVISQAKTDDIEIGSVKVLGDDILVSWKDGTTYGVDKVDTSNKYTSAYIETRTINVNRDLMKDMTIKVYYKSLPASTAITLYADKNNTGSYTELTSHVDATRRCQEASVRLTDVMTVQFKVGFTVSSNNAPEIESIIITY